MKPLKAVVLLAISWTTVFICPGQTIQESLDFQAELNEKYADTARSPLKEKDLAAFTGLDFYPADSAFIIKTRFFRTPGQKPFKMRTTTDRRPVYEKYGEAHFTIGGSSFMLNVYQSHRLREKEGYEDYLFLPFTDLTNGFGSYGGGRYIDLKIPAGDTLVIDFNRSYNPYCCYNYKYSCPVPPKENHLPVQVTAGVKAWGE